MFCPNIVLLGTYVGGPILGFLCFYIWSKYFYKGVSKVSELFLLIMGQSNKLIAKDNFELRRHYSN
jgi:hypothetical protein